MMVRKQEGIHRPLTFGEVVLARTVYGNLINYSKVVVHCDSYLPFGLQSSDYGMTPNGELWFRSNLYRDDYSLERVSLKHLFLHEMAHVWQHQRGMWVRTRGLFSWAVAYRYKLDKSRLSDYGMEQQAAIIADYWYLKTQGINAFFAFRDRYYIGITDKTTLSAFKPIIKSAGLPL